MSSNRLDKHVLILGCGFTGVALAQRLAFKGEPVVGTTRNDLRASIIRTRGAHPLLWDGRDLDVLAPWRGRIRSVVYSIPPAVSADGAPDPALAAVLGFFADAPPEQGIEAFVYLSSTAVYGDRQGEVVTEATAPAPDSPRAVARLAAEQLVREAPLKGIVVRPSGIYGPGRSLLHRLAAGQHRVIGDGAALSNRVHVADLAATLEAARKRGRQGAVYLGSDASPAPQREVVDHAVATFGLPAARAMSLAEARIRLDKDTFAMLAGSKRVDAAATHAELGVRLKFPSFREGFADLWRRERTEIEALRPPVG